jgi:lipopolysaccharide biosynthesis glycosyltransferase
MPTIEFILFAHGDKKDFIEFESLPNCRVLYNEETIRSPISSHWPVEMPAMYSRLLITKLLGNEFDRCLWMDADAVAMEDLTPLLEMDMQGEPVAGCLCHEPEQPNHPLNFLPYQFQNPIHSKGYGTTKTIQAGVYLVDNKKWNELNLDQEIDTILTSGMQFKYVVQGVLGLALKGRFTNIHMKWNCRPSQIHLLDKVGIFHYVGGANINPWLGTSEMGQFWEEHRNGYRNLYENIILGE